MPILEKALHKLDVWRSSYGDIETGFSTDLNHLEEIILTLEKRLEGNYPFHHPQYAGQMLKPPHPIAWLAYMITATVNPNNHALDGGPPTSEMEKEVISDLAGMVGYGNNALGHLTSAGTIANLEALFVARELHPGKAIAATANAHYTHRRMCRVLNTPFLEIPVNERGEPDFEFINHHHSEIGTIVVTMGTTGLGYTEPLKKMSELVSINGVRIHADAAYGGFFRLIADELPDSTDWQSLHLADSIVIDPHKHGLQPYGCGSVLYKDPSVGKFFKHDSPYTYFTSEELHLGEISLECSRAGASAAALWATLQLLPLNRDGLGSILLKARNAAVKFAEKVDKSPRFELYNEPDLDIVAYFKEPQKRTLSELNRLSKSVFEDGMKSKENGYHLSLFKVPSSHFLKQFPHYSGEEKTVTILRSVFMKEEHETFIDELADRLRL
ncbi:MAG: aspartate aminotransferase family protein [Balneolaceae bacterium]|nr:MAG: aspartate aminotransferase family protein [Balneolaceae bacterium]